MINLFIANTDNAWFDFLSAESDVTEVNFWWPGETNFKALQRGKILAFRLKSPRNKIGGFGIFYNHTRLPIQMAWETFGRSNGVSSLEDLRSAIAQLRTNIAVGPSTDIGSTILVQPVFFPPYLWFDVPASWSQSIQRGKLYSTDSTEGFQLWDRHSIFDAGYVTIKDDFTFSVSKKVKEIFNNGEEYLRLHGALVRRPERRADWPDTEFLKWHNKERYLG